MAYIDIPCTPLGSTVSGYCGDEHVKWMSDTRLALSNQGIDIEAFAHVICKWGHTNECDIISLFVVLLMACKCMYHPPGRLNVSC